MYGLVKSAFAAVVAASVLVQAVYHDNQPRRRKSLGYGPPNPRATFVSAPEKIYEQYMPSWFHTEFTAYELADTFVNTLLHDHLLAGSSYEMRDDSYTDSNTGVTHVYYRQIINGIPVVDGDLNVNIKDGIVLSYGDSFYRGDIPDMNANPAEDLKVQNPVIEQCRTLQNNLFALMRSSQPQEGQTILGQSTGSFLPHEAEAVAYLYSDNCLFPDVPYPSFQTEQPFSSATHAVLRFMVAASPDPAIVELITNSYSKEEFSFGDIDTTVEEAHIDGRSEQLLKLHNVPGSISPVKLYRAYIQLPHGDSTVLSPVWKMIVEMEDNWYEASVGTQYPFEIYSVVDWASDAAMAPIPKVPTEHEPASYNIFKWGVNDPSCGNRSMETENDDKLASPFGWHKMPAANYPGYDLTNVAKPEEEILETNTTFGNNVFAHENWEGRNNWLYNRRPDSPEKVFNYTYNPAANETEDPLEEAHRYINATVTQLFYTVNMIHDLYYRYGFDEVSGNFQQHNFGRGGKENDAVIANAQDGSGYNNANFMTPPDGENGRCRMYVWNTATPYRDGDLEAGIVIHEVTHGMSTRLTGGPANSGCLGFGEAGGMGEGWGDFLATTIRSTSNYSDYAMGDWAANRETGIRNYVYSLNMTVNPSTYKTLDKPAYWGVHAIGEVWAEILWIASNKIINKYGFSDTLFPPNYEEDGTLPNNDFYRPVEYDINGKPRPLIPKHGNTLMVQLVLNGMKLQPCRPSFFDARDAIIQADQILTNGENFCDLWNAFSERGLGVNAKVVGQTPWGGGIRTDGYKTHNLCEAEKVPKTPGDDDGDDDDDDDDF